MVHFPHTNSLVSPNKIILETKEYIGNVFHHERGPGLIPLRFHLVPIRSSIVAILFRRLPLPSLYHTHKHTST